MSGAALRSSGRGQRPVTPHVSPSAVTPHCGHTAPRPDWVHRCRWWEGLEEPCRVIGHRSQVTGGSCVCTAVLHSCLCNVLVLSNGTNTNRKGQDSSGLQVCTRLLVICATDLTLRLFCGRSAERAPATVCEGGWVRPQRRCGRCGVHVGRSSRVRSGSLAAGPACSSGPAVLPR